MTDRLRILLTGGLFAFAHGGLGYYEPWAALALLGFVVGVLLETMIQRLYGENDRLDAELEQLGRATKGPWESE